MSTLIVIAKEPRPGHAKTRLTPPLAPHGAAAVAGAALADTLELVDDTAAHERILAFAGDASEWLPPAWRLVPQPGGGLDERLVAAFETVGGPAVLVGMDTPQFRPAQLETFDPDRYDACLGLATDGGFWAIGFDDPSKAEVIRGVPMSTATTGAEQLARMRRVGLRVQLLDELTDVDDITSAQEVARLIPDSRFARALSAALERAA